MLLFVYRMQTQEKYLNLANAVFSLKHKKKKKKKEERSSSKPLFLD